MSEERTPRRGRPGGKSGSGKPDFRKGGGKPGPRKDGEKSEYRKDTSKGGPRKDGPRSDYKPGKPRGDKFSDRKSGKDGSFRKDGPYKDRQGRDGARPQRDMGETREEAKERLAGAAAEKNELLESKMPGLAARRAAVDILGLMRKGRSLDDALDECRSFNALEGADRGFARHMVSTSWRRRGAVDAVIGEWLDRPLPNKNIEVMDILRITAVQLLLLQTPAHAAVATATELAGQKQETRPFAKLVNAISRRIADKGLAKLAEMPLRTDTPGWLWRALERNYGPAKVARIAEAHQAEAPLDLTLKPGTDGSTLRGLDGALSLLPGHVRLSSAHDVKKLPGYDAGGWWVQDIAASLPARLLGDVAGLGIIDLCAAPGGKTLQLTAGGAAVTAVDISGYRLKRLQENLGRTGLAATTEKADILEWTPEELADAVLLDAPCTATGTMRRNPDVAWSKSEKDVKDLAALQGKMIDRALAFLKPGGRLVYCVCSLLKAEGEDQIRAALKRHDGLAIEPIGEDTLPGLKAAIAKDGTIRTLPSMKAAAGGMDGFFAAVLRKPA